MTQAIEAKLNRGPMHGKRMVVDGYGDIIVSKPPDLFRVLEKKEMDPSLPMEMTRGSYAKSNRQLKDGAWVYEWMGWYGK